MTTALRSFLQYARYRGLIAADLRDSVPTVANWSMASLPNVLSVDEVQRLLSGCERKTAVGRRNGAILLLLARLGLRAGEVVGLTLDDIDWTAGTLCIHGAGSRVDRLPIPQDVGAALADYLCHVRPVCASRRVFVRMRAPHRGFANSVAISSLVRRALARSAADRFPTALDMRAELDADGTWRISGQKIFITSGHGKWHFVIARTEDATDPNDPYAGLAGLSMFLVKAYDDLPNGEKKRYVTLDRFEEKLGPAVIGRFDLQYAATFYATPTIPLGEASGESLGIRAFSGVGRTLLMDELEAATRSLAVLYLEHCGVV